MNHGTAVLVAKEIRSGGYKTRTDGHKIIVDNTDKRDIELFLRECHPTIKFCITQISSNQVEIMVLL